MDYDGGTTLYTAVVTVAETGGTGDEAANSAFDKVSWKFEKLVYKKYLNNNWKIWIYEICRKIRKVLKTKEFANLVKSWKISGKILVRILEERSKTEEKQTKAQK